MPSIGVFTRQELAVAERAASSCKGKCGRAEESALPASRLKPLGICRVLGCFWKHEAARQRGNVSSQLIFEAFSHGEIRSGMRFASQSEVSAKERLTL